MFTCSKGNTVVTVHTCTYEKYIELSKKGQIFEGGEWSHQMKQFQGEPRGVLL